MQRRWAPFSQGVDDGVKTLYSPLLVEKALRNRSKGLPPFFAQRLHK
jgi:hypothetical protein